MTRDAVRDLLVVLIKSVVGPVIAGWILMGTASYFVSDAVAREVAGLRMSLEVVGGLRTPGAIHHYLDRDACPPGTTKQDWSVVEFLDETTGRILEDVIVCIVD